jgi:hypothetical protein
MRRIGVFTLAALSISLVLAGCKAEMASDSGQVTRGTHLVLLESGIHWAEWIKHDNTPCGDIYKWNDSWMADTYNDGGLEQHPFDTKDEAVAYVQKWCQ